MKILLTFITTLFLLNGCDSGSNATSPNMSEISFGGTWQVSQTHTYSETDEIDGTPTKGYPWSSGAIDTTFQFSKLYTRHDTLILEGWLETTGELLINYHGEMSGSKATLKGVRMNSPTTPWLTESYTATATTNSDNSITITFDTKTTFSYPNSIHGYGEKSSATFHH